MKHENYIKEKLTDYESPMDMSSMWAELEKDLDQEQKKERGFWFWGIRWFSIISLLAIAAWLIHPMINQSSKTLSNNEIKTPFESKSVAVENTKEINDQITNENIEPIVTSENKSLANQPIENSSTKTPTTSSNTNQKSNKQTKQNYFSSRETKTSSEQLNEINSVNRANISTSNTTQLPTSQKTNIFPVVLKLDQLENDTRLLDPLGLLAVKRYLIDWNENRDLDIDKPDKESRRVPNIKVAKSNGKIWRASFNYGQTISRFNFLEENLIEAAPDLFYNSATNNHSFGIGLERVLKNNLKFGIEYNYINHGILHTRNDTFTGLNRILEQKVVYVDELGEVIGEEFLSSFETPDRYSWEFQNYNKLHSMEFTPMIGYELGYNKFDFSLSAGPGINLILWGAGAYPRTNFVNIGELEAIATEDINIDNSYFKEINLLLSAKLKAQVGYKLTDNLRSFVGIEGSKLFGEVAKDIGDIPRTRLSYFGARTGISYTF